MDVIGVVGMETNIVAFLVRVASRYVGRQR